MKIELSDVSSILTFTKNKGIVVILSLFSFRVVKKIYDLSRDKTEKRGPVSKQVLPDKNFSMPMLIDNKCRIKAYMFHPLSEQNVFERNRKHKKNPITSFNILFRCEGFNKRQNIRFISYWNHASLWNLSENIFLCDFSTKS